ncbi:Precorrin-2 oxidase @ Sirohydrochlorin ferrochelatase activity of CysG / Uroporphyrinogen-III methyltransferase [hydrothermal vent metagenome]|uniref:uroporphyrinogen-III C-methyltransferase n=1 Tax=hydrothermal vent metagenome TaxID=652676 RepID=A0A3B1DYA8_9ZZZZ
MKTKRGKVYLVGGGPGDAGLLTLRGAECLRLADVVLYDGLVNPLLLRHSKATTQRTCRTTGPAGRTLNQTEINSRLIEEAQQGKIVVRLKGGDPFIFGRGSEEAAALAKAGIPFEVIPGITAATAAGAYTGISLTHRNFSSAVAFITGHEDPAKKESSLDYKQLAQFPGTLVFYMGLHRLGKIINSLLQHGLKKTTPASVVSRASTSAQQTISAPLHLLAEKVRHANLHAPSLIIIGDCVLQREEISWFESRPLLGKRIGITRPVGQAEEAIQRCIALGAEPVLLPMIEILPPDNWTEVDLAIEQLAKKHHDKGKKYDWLIFTSANGVEGLMQRLWDNKKDSRLLAAVNIAVIGPATAAALEKYHLRADLMPKQYQAEGLVAALKNHVAGKQLLWAGANRGREVLQQELTAAGANIDKIVVYRNEDILISADDISKKNLDWIGLSSPSIARRFASIYEEEQEQNSKLRLAAISPVTAESLSKTGWQVDAIATSHTWEGLLEAVVKAESER